MTAGWPARYSGIHLAARVHDLKAGRSELTATTGRSWTPMQLLAELEPLVEANVNHHVAMASEWFPNQLSASAED